MLLKKSMTVVYLFFINIYAMTTFSDLKFVKKNESYYLVIPFYYKDKITKCELLIKNPISDFIYTTFKPINCHIEFDKNRITINLDKVKKDERSEFMIQVFTAHKEVLKSNPFVWSEEWGNFVSLKESRFN